jgi:predicted kinase
MPGATVTGNEAMAALHFICGKAGSGKTTLARELGRDLPAVVLCEDEWIATLGFEVRSVEDYVRASRTCRALMRPLAIDILRTGSSVVLDFAGNTVADRQWTRGVFEAAGADHLLHVIEADDATCLRGLRSRNAERPAGIYWGDVDETMFAAVTAHFVPPGETEGFRLRAHRRS